MPNSSLTFPLSCIISLSLLAAASLLFSLPPRTHLRYRSLPPIEIIKAHSSSLLPLRAEKAALDIFNDSFLVEDALAFPDYLMLLVRSPSNGSEIGQMHNFDCVFGSQTRTPVLKVEKKEPGLVMAMCPHPKLKINGTVSITLGMKSMDVKLLSYVYYPTNHSWDWLVYEALSLPGSVLLFAKGSSFKRTRILDRPNQFACFYGSNVKTKVLLAAQEVVHCERPPVGAEQSLAGAKVSLWEAQKGIMMPSVATFDPKISFDKDETPKKHYLCACSMVWNQADFLKEWIMYHSWLGVERWFLYDNNSDDNIEEVVRDLSIYNVSRHIWPWVKTQEAGFSHCAIRARSECTWVMFTDVDEFIYPERHLQQGLQDTILRKIIQNVSSSVGEVRVNCLNFGPSGLSQSPKEGVTVGYTCRMHAPERHKSIVKLEALNGSLLNVVHHFHLKSGFKHMDMPMKLVVINHYKYQVWEVFKRKFVRRVATYVTDWGEKQNESSKDRTPGLGTEAIEPSDWKHRFCEVNDSGLKNLALQIFAKDISDQGSLQWKWQK